ncbi:MAG TPA: PQQ-binding-like beta-propeller repeat protein, partial [Pirellulales bacterium]|nr:PQQ-binding-like beta-propeller repeat protein [Pirellulales bacterium]
MRTCLIAWLLVVSTASAIAEDAWTQFRGPDGAGLSDAKGVPVEWSETKHVKWKTPIPGKAWSSPVVWDKQVWVTNATEDGKRLSALCLDRTSG